MNCAGFATANRGVAILHQKVAVNNIRTIADQFHVPKKNLERMARLGENRSNYLKLYGNIEVTDGNALPNMKSPLEAG